MLRGYFLLMVLLVMGCTTQPVYVPRATGDLGVVIERATGSVLIVDSSHHTVLQRIEGLGDLSHASVVYSRDERYAYVFGRDGGLTQVDLLLQRIERRIVQGGNSIGGAISQDGKLIAVSNYEPGGVKVFRSDTLELVADIPAEYAPGRRSKTVGLVDAPNQQFLFSLYDGDQIWRVDFSEPAHPVLEKFPTIGRQPYDALITSNGRYYMAGLFGEDGMALIDLWDATPHARKILPDYGRGSEKLPVYKMPHLEGWTVAGRHAFFPAVGRNEVLVMDMDTFQLIDKIPVHGQPVFVMARPDDRQIWVNFAHPDNDTLQVIDVPTRKIIKTLQPGPAVLHMEFTSRGEQAWISIRDANQINIYDTRTLERIAQIPAQSPSGIFFTKRAHEIGL
ncbi:MAG: cytochrome D1 domain-containing protein [Gammaproteobacteria bacterium]